MYRTHFPQPRVLIVAAVLGVLGVAGHGMIMKNHNGSSKTR